MKALPIDVYRADNRDCTSGGISSRFSQLLLICPDGYITVDEENLPKNLVKLVKVNLCGNDTYHIEPYAEAEEIGWMFGGNYGATSDFRFMEMTGIYGALAIHDRQETQEQYDLIKGTTQTFDFSRE